MSKQNNYEMIPEKGTSLYRIRALRDIPKHGVLKGQIGGLIEREFNLSQSDGGWIRSCSMVTDDARVLNGLIERKSQVKDTAVVSFEIVSGSIVQGSSKINGNFTIDNSDINNTQLVGAGSVKASTLENVVTKSGVDIRDCYIKATDKFTAEQTIVLDNVQIVVEDGFFNSILTWKHVDMKARCLMVNEHVWLKDVQVDVSDVFWVQKGELFSTYKSEIIGKYMEQPVVIKGTSFRLKSTSIVGVVTIDGEVDVIESSIRDMVHIYMHGILENCHLSEMASVQLSPDKNLKIFDLVLNGDNAFLK